MPSMSPWNKQKRDKRTKGHVTAFSRKTTKVSHYRRTEVSCYVCKDKRNKKKGRNTSGVQHLIASKIRQINTNIKQYFQLSTLLHSALSFESLSLSIANDNVAVTTLLFFPSLTDINDCLTNNGGCQQNCFNRPGPGVICTCSQGYTRSGKLCYGKNCPNNAVGCWL